jgi:ferric-dicitrate binding protein FerR (iron transport regulator)
MNDLIYKQTLRALFEGRATAPQKSLILDFLSVPENQELYFLWLEEWELQNPQLIAETDAAYLRVVEKSVIPLKNNPSRSVDPNRLIWLIGIAASVTFLLIITGYFYKDSILNKQYSTAYGELKSFVLADGSKVVLNANSTLTVPRFDFGKKSREVRLSGEAAFSVTHLANNCRFIVRTPDELEIQVLGTEFMVYSRAKGSKVALTKGKVRLRSLKKPDIKPLIINPGDVVLVSKQGSLTLSHHQSIAAHTGWKEHRFTFQNTPVSQIADQLNDVFGIRIIIADSALAKRTLGGTFKAETADQFLQVMADILEVRIIPGNSRKSPETYTLTY